MQDNVDAIYIHIPFCKKICAYCDFCKVFYNKKYVNKYLDSLKKEIKDTYKNEIITSLYIGGGTPSSLDLEQLNKLFVILKIFNLSKDCEITFEANPDSLTLDKIKLLVEFGVNRVSLGVETINKDLQKIIERNTDKNRVIECINNLKYAGINNINLDLIYAIKGETLTILKKDLDFIISLDVPHISTYSLIIENNTKLKIEGFKNITKSLDRDMYNLISNTLSDNNYIHYEISNFAKEGYQSRHNLKYWNNKHYYGFGVGASSYIGNIRYTNTKSITKYIEGKRVLDKEILKIKDTIFYEVMLGFRTNKGINKKDFSNRYGLKINDLFNYKDLVKKNVIVETDRYLIVKEEYFYVLDEVILQFLNTLQTNVYGDIMK